MDEYVVGSIADLISNKKSSKVKTKKQKNKGEEPVIQEKIIEPEIKSKKKKKNVQLVENSESETLEPTIFKTAKIKSSKKKKNERLVENSESKTLEPTTFKTANIKSSKKKKNEELVDNSESKTLDPTVSNKTNKLKLNNDSKPKKRKKQIGGIFDSEDFKEMPELKKSKTDMTDTTDILDFDHKPSDSEEEQEKEIVDKKPTPKKFTKEDNFKNFEENTVFVGNIPINYNTQKIRKVFSKYGEIQTARIRCVPVADINMSKKVAAIKKKFNPKRSSVAAYIKYKSLDSAKAALDANGMVIDGHHIRVDLAEEKKERDNNKAVFVGGLPFDTEDDELWNHFQNCGKINSVRIIRDSQTSMGKGFGYVNFDSTASVELALQLDGEQFRKRTLNVKRCVKTKNKTKFNTFNKDKSKELTNELISKKTKKFKIEKKKLKIRNKKLPTDFQGKTANMKQKKKKKLSQNALRRRKLVKLLGAS